ncbi:Peptidase C48, SUMO/Sentrin/Ubl1 [Carpediemonas membranifera]|uniref:Peptidase C48, SUMO/Sentrin/Ubl1 n=1 Tax=Carpediemonas membranifera TaxID=201153 RepID=A0A8J6AUL2_9EUKA|nr:Peptidase C48, SUMO/Sentrin/Ubl1 [Carpediemonas membranifera]|eukprot:KAG9392870.1 Peptidase C48, SUMO/Sentrin/Ubl1 [Carpediemonas membranifera]
MNLSFPVFKRTRKGKKVKNRGHKRSSMQDKPVSSPPHRTRVRIPLKPRRIEQQPTIEERMIEMKKAAAVSREPAHSEVPQPTVRPKTRLQTIAEVAGMPSFAQFYTKIRRLPYNTRILGQLYRRGLSPLFGTDWLTDEVINTYGDLLQNHARKVHGRRVFVLSSFFYSTLCPRSGYNYKAVSRWATRTGASVPTLDALVLPVNHDNSHWTAAAVCFDARVVVYYDSLGRRRRDIPWNLIRFVCAEVLAAGGDPVAFFKEDWRTVICGRVSALDPEMVGRVAVLAAKDRKRAMHRPAGIPDDADCIEISDSDSDDAAPPSGATHPEAPLPSPRPPPSQKRRHAMTKRLSQHPCQLNGFDCGVFASMFMRCVALGAGPAFRQADMPNIRRLMVVELGRRRITPIGLVPARSESVQS